MSRDFQNRAEIARARSLAEQGFAEMAREILRHCVTVPQIVAEVPSRRRTARDTCE